jgi:4-amino-4-deoxy-L-arabinose transferase-like glycosyltransferase
VISLQGRGQPCPCVPALHLLLDMDIFSNHRKPKTDHRKPLIELSSEWRLFLGLALMGLVLFFYRLGVPGLMDPDEGRYAEIAREIWVLKDWLIPHLNFLPYLEKPPLVYWLTALSFGGLGMNEGAARLPAAVSALAGVFLAYGLGRALWGRTAGLLSALVLATCGGYIALGRLLTLDMALAFFLNLGVGLGYLAMSRDRPDLWPWAYLSLGLGVLTKGPVAVVLAALVWGSWVLAERRPGRSLVHPAGWLILGLMGLPWFAWATWRYPDFFRFFVLEQHLGRYLTASIHHHEPVYFYLPVLFVFMLPWSWLLPWALGRRGAAAPADRRFLMIWAGVILIFFSFSRGKLAPYILPALLPLALLVGEGLAGLVGARREIFRNRGLALSLMIWLLAGWAAVALYFWYLSLLTGQWAQARLLSPYLPLGLILLALMPGLALIFKRVEVLLLGALLLGLMVPGGIEQVSTWRSPREVGRVLRANLQAGGSLIGYHLYSQGLSFYSGEVFHLLEFSTELDFGRRLDRGSGLFFPNPEEMMAFAGSHAPAFFFLKEKYFPSLRQMGPGKFHLLARHKDCILVVYSQR